MKENFLLIKRKQYCTFDIVDSNKFLSMRGTMERMKAFCEINKWKK
jgi:hypothetical protein